MSSCPNVTFKVVALGRGFYMFMLFLHYISRVEKSYYICQSAPGDFNVLHLINCVE